MSNKKRSPIIYDIKNIQTVYSRHKNFCGTVLYSEDGGYVWKSVGMDSGKWNIHNWLFAFVEIPNSEKKTYSTMEKKLKNSERIANDYYHSLIERKNWIKQANLLIKHLLKENRLTKEELKKYIPKKEK